MLAFRTTWYIKPGKMDRAVEILLAEGRRFAEVRKAKGIGVTGEGRIYSPLYSPDALVMEIVFESIAEHDAFWGTYDGDSAAGQTFWTEWYSLVDHRGSGEVWQVHTN